MSITKLHTLRYPACNDKLRNTFLDVYIFVCFSVLVRLFKSRVSGKGRCPCPSVNTKYIHNEDNHEFKISWQSPIKSVNLLCLKLDEMFFDILKSSYLLGHLTNCIQTNRIRE